MNSLTMMVSSYHWDIDWHDNPDYLGNLHQETNLSHVRIWEGVAINSMGGRALLFSGQKVLDQWIALIFTFPHSSWTAAIQSGGRDARHNQSHQRTQGNVLWWRGGCGQRRGWVAATLLSPPHQYTLCIGRNTPSINRRSVLVAPLCFICTGYNWEPSTPSGEAEKWSNSEIGPTLYAISVGRHG
jgi:hypothetical protein